MTFRFYILITKRCIVRKLIYEHGKEKRWKTSVFRLHAMRNFKVQCPLTDEWTVRQGESHSGLYPSKLSLGIMNLSNHNHNRSRNVWTRDNISSWNQNSSFLLGGGVVKIEGLSVVEHHLMLRFPVRPNRNTSFPETPFLHDHIWSYVEISSPCSPLQFTMLPCRQNAL